jgi:hypothetical protein
MPSADVPAHELIVADASTPELREQCMKIRFAGTTRVLWQAIVLAPPYPFMRFYSNSETQYLSMNNDSSRTLKLINVRMDQYPISTFSYN